MAGSFAPLPRDYPDLDTGARGPDTVASSRLVVDMKDDIVIFNPNAAPFQTFTKRLRNTRTVSQFRYDLLEKDQKPKLMTVSADATSGATAIFVGANETERARVGDLVLNMTTREVYRVGAIPSSTELTVRRAIGSDPGGVAVVAGQKLLIFSSAHEDGAASSSMLSTVESNRYNYTQIVRNKFGQTGRLANTKLYGGNDMMTERKIQGIEHNKDIERIMFWGRRGSFTGTGGHLVTTTGGLEQQITLNLWDMGGIAPTERTFDEFLEEGMRMGKGGYQNGNSIKYLFMPARLMTIINAWAKDRIRLAVMDDTIGFAVKEYLSPFGTVRFVHTPILDEDGQNTRAFFIDLNHVRQAVHAGRDTVLLKDRQDNDVDGTEEEYLTDCGLDFEFDQAHAIISNWPV